MELGETWDSGKCPVHGTLPSSAVKYHIHEPPSGKTADGNRYHEVKKPLDGAKAFLGKETVLKDIPED